MRVKAKKITLKRSMAIVCMLWLSNTLFSQTDDHKFNVVLSYPLSVGEDLYKEIYTGVVGSAISYELTKFGPLSLGISTDVVYSSGGTLLLGSTTPFEKAHSILLQPRANMDINLVALPKWHLILGVGYTTQWVKYELRPGREDRGLDISERYGGVNFGSGLQYDLSNSVFITTHYDHTAVSTGGVSEDFSKNIETVSLLKIGLGYRF